MITDWRERVDCDTTVIDMIEFDEDFSKDDAIEVLAGLVKEHPDNLRYQKELQFLEQ